jgi:hypothetical protein
MRRRACNAQTQPRVIKRQQDANAAAYNNAKHMQMQLRMARCSHLAQRGKLRNERKYEVGLDLRDRGYDIEAAAGDTRALKTQTGNKKHRRQGHADLAPDADRDGGVSEGLRGVEEEDVEKVFVLQHARVELNNKRGLGLWRKRVGGGSTCT